MLKIDSRILAQIWMEEGVFEDKAKNYDKDVEVLANAWIEYNKVLWSMVGKYGEEISDFMMDQMHDRAQKEIDDMSLKAYQKLSSEVLGNQDFL